MAYAAPPILTGIWSGQAVFAGEEAEAVPLLWNLSLSHDPSGAVPQAFGASLAADGRTVRILSGTWSAETLHVSLDELSTEAGAASPLLSFRGRLNARAEGGALSITGEVTQRSGAGDGGEGAQKGSFGLVREAEQETSRVAIFVGMARPDASLADFDIPSNPVHISLALLASAPEEGRVTAFGAGYLNDAADVPDKPMLFYSVAGTHDPATKEVRLTKRYQYEAETEGYEVTYDLKTVEDEEDDTVYLEGKWDNPKGGSFGKLSCRRINPSRIRINGLVIST